MRRRSLLLALPLSAALAACGAATRAGGGASSGSAGASAGGTPSLGSETKGDGGAFTVVDVVGRSVEFASQPQKVVLSESRHAFSLFFLNKDKPLDKIVAWGTDLQKAAPDFYDQLLKVAPEAADIPTIGSVSKGDLTVETLVQYEADVLLLTLDAYNEGKDSGFLDSMDKQGLTYVVTDFRRYPGENTAASVSIIGAVMDYRDKAEAFLTFYHEQVDPVLEKAKSVDPKPQTFLWRAPAITDSCSTYSSKANLGMLVAQTGGQNVADDLLTGDDTKGGEEGVITPEQIIKIDPANIIATGGEWGQQTIKDSAKTSYVHLGYKADEASAKASLAQLQDQPGFEQLSAFGNKQVFGVYHQFYDAPYNFIAYLAFAKWQNPSTFPDLDPDAVWKDFHDKFMPWKAEGVFVVGI